VLTPAMGPISDFSVAFIPPEPDCVLDGSEVFPSEVSGAWVLVGLAVGEPKGVGFGVAFGVPFTTGDGSAPPALMGVLVAVGMVTVGVLMIGVGVAAGMIGVGVGAFVGVGVGAANVAVGVGVTPVVAVGVSVGVGVMSAGTDVIPGVAVSTATVITEAWMVVCIATMPMTENNSNAELIARARKTQ
jgi:hypothetical protein